MKNWTDNCINWNQLPGTEVKRLIATWGFTPEQIAKYDKKHGFQTTPAKPVTPQVPALKGMTPLGIKPVAKKAVVKKVAVKAPLRQKHTGADGEIKFVEHRNLFVGFFGGRVVVTKRTAEACKEFLVKEFGIAQGE
jgi:hypothetical protein